MSSTASTVTVIQIPSGLAEAGDHDKSSNAPAIVNVNMRDRQAPKPPNNPELNLTQAAVTTTQTSVALSTVHDHRLSHTPSKLPGLRLVDRGLLQAQNAPRSLPQPAVSPSAGADSAVSTAATAATGTVRAENSTSTHAGKADSPPSRPSASVPTPSGSGPAAHASGLSSVLHPVTELDETPRTRTHPQSAVDLLPHTTTSAPNERTRRPIASSNDQNLLLSQVKTRQTASAVAVNSTPTAAKVGIPTTPRRDNATAGTSSALISSPLTHQADTGTDSSHYYTPTTRPRTRRNSSWGSSPSAARPPARRNSSWDSASARSAFASRAILRPRSLGTATNNSTCDQRECTSPKATTLAISDEHNKALPRRIPSASRPPNSHRPIQLGATPGRIPPIRAFRPSGSRKSWPADMNNSSSRYYDDGDEYQDHSSRDRSLRALEGRRYTNDRSRDFVHANMDQDDDVAESENNTADIFMNIARENFSASTPRRSIDHGSDDAQNTVSRVVRTARTPRSRPQSIYSSTIHRPPSPPPVARRLSDQQVSTSRTTKRAPDDQPEQQTIQDAGLQNSAMGRPSLKLDSSRGSSRVPTLKPSPITPRTQSVVDNSVERNSIFARRPPTRTGDGHTRSSSLKQPSGLSKSFNSSPLVPKNGFTQQNPNGQHVEASESSNSTAAPSTVWDELDELKSRIHRLELTGKLPKTSSAAISRAPEERPPTAGTGATTLSGSPKRAQTELVSLATSQKETQSNLKSILSKTKPFVSSDVYEAIEAAANDALSLSQLMGTAGQQGPISSGASTIGVGGPSTITDRQLRKKTDSICRSLTELCIALKEDEPDRKTTSTSRPQTRGTSLSGRDEAPRSPPMRVFNGTGPDEPLSSIEVHNSPRVTRLDKRATFNFTGMSGISNEPSPRYASSIIGGGDDNTMTGRKSSLVLARARRGVTEEPDDQGRKTSLLRTRRTASEEPEEQEGNRRSSMIFAPRRVTTIGRVSNIDEEPQMQSRAPSRAFTEVGNARADVGNGLRINVPNQNSIARRPMGQEPASANAALPRTRLLTSGLPTPGPFSSRMMTPTTPSGRRFLQVNRQLALEENNTNTMSGRLADERQQRYSIAAPPSASVSRGPSLHRKRHSGIPSISGTASNVGGYR